MKEVQITEQKIKVGEIFINYAISKVEGTKPKKTLILMPGFLGKNIL